RGFLRDVVFEDHLALQFAQGGMPIEGDLRPGRVSAAEFVDVGGGMDGQVELNGNKLLSVDQAGPCKYKQRAAGGTRGRRVQCYAARLSSYQVIWSNSAIRFTYFAYFAVLFADHSRTWISG